MNISVVCNSATIQAVDKNQFTVKLDIDSLYEILADVPASQIIDYAARLGKVASIGNELF